jgi:putative holliday junction resolvase
LEEKRILAIDYGSKRIGIAITDPLNMFAYPLTTLLNDSHFIPKLQQITKEYSVVKILIGIPLREDGSESVTAKAVLVFKELIAKNFTQEIEMVDERYTSEIAKQRIIESVPSKKKRRDKSLLDKNAAAVILEDYLKMV